MRRRRNDKRVLISRNQPKKSNRRILVPGNNSSRSGFNRRNNSKKPKKPRNGKLVFLMIIALVAFLVGAGIGVSLSLSNGDDANATHVENVTVEMTTNLTNDTEISYVDEIDGVDYNNPQSIENMEYYVEQSANEEYYEDYGYDESYYEGSY